MANSNETVNIDRTAPALKAWETIRRNKAADTIMVFTYKSAERILEMGGTATWKIKPEHARQCQYAVCTRNTKHKHCEGREPHRTGFLVGRMSGMFSERGNGYLIHFSEYAQIDIPDMWNKQRQPVYYTKLADLGIDPEKLDWKPMPEQVSKPADESLTTTAKKTNGDVERPLTIAEAKKGLALMFNVSPNAIDITIRA